jgi:hypothetical protein
MQVFYWSKTHNKLFFALFFFFFFFLFFPSLLEMRERERERERLGGLVFLMRNAQHWDVGAPIGMAKTH